MLFRSKNGFVLSTNASKVLVNNGQEPPVVLYKMCWIKSKPNTGKPNYPNVASEAIAVGFSKKAKMLAKYVRLCDMLIEFWVTRFEFSLTQNA